MMCDNGVGVAMVLQLCGDGVTVMLQWWYSIMTVL
jgi:hypothetical protein